jgi:putative hydrolase of the HAD superfamily
MFDVIAFDADDTLWHNETLYSDTQTRFKALLSNHRDPDAVEQALYHTEMRNLPYFGYGIKAFTLSMIETAIELTGGQIQGSELQKIIELAKEMLQAEVKLLDHVEETVSKLAESHALMIITKGDLMDQEAKIARSGLMKYFKYVEIISTKNKDTYAAILEKHRLDPSQFLMVGNSLKSDILPVVELGGYGVYIPYHITWAHETVPENARGQEGHYELEHIGLLPALVEKLSSR